MRTLHVATRTIAFAIRSVDPTYSYRGHYPLIPLIATRTINPLAQLIARDQEIAFESIRSAGRLIATRTIAFAIRSVDRTGFSTHYYSIAFAIRSVDPYSYR